MSFRKKTINTSYTGYSNFGEDPMHLCFATFIHFITKSLHYKIIN